VELFTAYGISVHEINRYNYEQILDLGIHEEQRAFVPSVLESLAYAYIKPWDEAFDIFALYQNDIPVGLFYISYTPESLDNYWLGGFFVSKEYQNKGVGKLSFACIMDFIKNKYTKCQVLSLTVENSNLKAKSLYEKFGFISDGELNQDKEVIYKNKDMRSKNGKTNL
jgi:diamine N-acetyltransferase